MTEGSNIIPIHAPESCAHCGLPLPAMPFDDEFCCTGCSLAYSILKNSGLGNGFKHDDLWFVTTR